MFLSFQSVGFALLLLKLFLSKYETMYSSHSEGAATPSDLAGPPQINDVLKRDWIRDWTEQHKHNAMKDGEAN